MNGPAISSFEVPALESLAADLKERSAGMKAHWQQEKDAIQKIREAKEKIEKARFETDQATQRGDLILEVEIVVPEKLTEEQEKMMKEFAEAGGLKY